MKRMIDYFEMFCKAVIENKLYEDPLVYFNEVCNSIKIPPRPLNEYIRKEFGMDGDDMLEILKARFNAQELKN